MNSTPVPAEDEAADITSLREKRLLEFVQELSDDDRRIVERHWGIGREPMTLTQVAEDLEMRMTLVGRRAGALARQYALVIARQSGPKAEKEKTAKPAPDTLMIGGMTITRHGLDSYCIDGQDMLSADQVGAMIHERIDADSAADAATTLGRRDKWLASGYRRARFGTQWPHPTGYVVRLPLPPTPRGTS